MKHIRTWETLAISIICIAVIYSSVVYITLNLTRPQNKDEYCKELRSHIEQHMQEYAQTGALPSDQEMIELHEQMRFCVTPNAK